MYAQKLEGDSWRGEKMDPAKLEKMSGEYLSGLIRFLVQPSDRQCFLLSIYTFFLLTCMSCCRSTNRPAV